MNLNTELVNVNHLSNLFLSKLEVLKQISHGDKLIIQYDCLQKDQSWSIFQPISRWWNNQSRISLCNYLNTEFEAYCNFLSCLDDLIQNETQTLYSHKLKHMATTHKIFISNIYNGISCLKTTYSEDEDVKICLNEILEKLSGRSVYHRLADSID